LGFPYFSNRAPGVYVPLAKDPMSVLDLHLGRAQRS
jgi:hypothetical protein